MKHRIVKLLDQVCRVETAKNKSRKSHKSWPRLRVVDGAFMLMTEAEKQFTVSK